jgi:hypothetical protein
MEGLHNSRRRSSDVGGIVAGGEAESLREHICGLFQDHGNIVLHFGEVVGQAVEIKCCLG